MAVRQEDELKHSLRVALCDQAIGIRDRRRLVEQRWLNSRRVWMNFEVERRFMPSDTSATPYQIPSARRAAERTIVRGVKLLTPNVKWFEVAPGNDVSEDKLTNVDNYTWYVLRKKIKSRSNIGMLVRSMFLYSMCHLKTSISVKNGQVWPSQRVVDPFSFYIFPETSANIDEAEVVFEDFLFSYERYSTFARKGIVDELPRNAFTKPDWPYHMVERLAYQGITDPTANTDLVIQNTKDALDKTTSGFASLTEMWLTREDKLYQVYICWNLKRGPRIVGFIESQYDTPLYRSVLHRPLPGETYTNSMMEDIVALDTLSNDQLNKFQEAVDREQGMYGVNDQMVTRMDSIKVKGGAVWHFNDDPRLGVAFFQPPTTSTNQLRAWQIYLGLINSLAGVGTIGEGQPGRNMPRAGNAVNSLISLSMADVQDLAELIEQEVLTPSLGDIYKVSQFIPDSQLMRIPGGKGLLPSGANTSILKRNDIIGDYEFEWVGAMQFQDESSRAQRLLIFLNMLPMLAPEIQKQGFAFNVVDLVKMIWRYGLGERGLSKVVMPIAEMQAQMQSMQGSGDMSNNAPSPTGSSTATAPSPANSTPGSLPGLKFNLPAITNGFVNQG